MRDDPFDIHFVVETQRVSLESIELVIHLLLRATKI